MPVFFAAKICDLILLTNTILAFVAFSLAASGVYILNDLRDVEEDRLHPEKRDRPLASGIVTEEQAVCLMVLLWILGFSLMASVSSTAVGILGVYVIMNIAYSLHLKYVAIIDIAIVATGFVLRLFVGAAAADITLSIWIVVMTFLLSLFIALAKRRDDVLIYLNTGKKTRRVVEGYNLRFLDTAMAIMASVVIVAYTIYTTSPQVVAKMHCKYLYLTAAFVVIGILRYLQIVFVMEESGSPTRIVLTDRFIQLTILGWGVTFAWIIY